MTRRRRFAALSAAAGFLLLPIAGCTGADQSGLEEGSVDDDTAAAVADTPEGEGRADSWRELVRTEATEGSDRCADLLPEEAAALVADFLGADLDWVNALGDEDRDAVMCSYDANTATTQERGVFIDIDLDTFMCDPPPMDGPEIHADPPKEEDSETLGGEEVGIRETSVTICTESSAAIQASLTAVDESDVYDLLADNDFTIALAESLVEHEAEVVDEAMTLREEALAAEG